MASAEETITIDAPVERVIAVLADPRQATEWFPGSVELEGSPGDRMEQGDEVVSRGELAGQSVAFDVRIDSATEDQVCLTATGPVVCRVASRARPAGAGTELTVNVDIESGGGVSGGVLAGAAKPLAAPWLRQAMDRIRARAEA